MYHPPDSHSVEQCVSVCPQLKSWPRASPASKDKIQAPQGPLRRFRRVRAGQGEAAALTGPGKALSSLSHAAFTSKTGELRAVERGGQCEDAGRTWHPRPSQGAAGGRPLPAAGLMSEASRSKASASHCSLWIWYLENTQHLGFSYKSPFQSASGKIQWSNESTLLWRVKNTI